MFNALSGPMQVLANYLQPMISPHACMQGWIELKSTTLINTIRS